MPQSRTFTDTDFNIQAPDTTSGRPAVEETADKSYLRRTRARAKELRLGYTQNGKDWSSASLGYGLCHMQLRVFCLRKEKYAAASTDLGAAVTVAAPFVAPPRAVGEYAACAGAPALALFGHGRLSTSDIRSPTSPSGLRSPSSPALGLCSPSPPALGLRSPSSPAFGHLGRRSPHSSTPPAVVCRSPSRQSSELIRQHVAPASLDEKFMVLIPRMSCSMSLLSSSCAHALTRAFLAGVREQLGHDYFGPDNIKKHIIEYLVAVRLHELVAQVPQLPPPSTLSSFTT
ncbi:hypothetical protein EV121DRAFT_296209 [Schizophyllum commune]